MAPEIITIEGVKIELHSRDHLPVHVHATYAEHEALVNIRTGELFEGDLPPKKLRIVQDWLAEGNNRELTEENFYELNSRLRPKEKEVAEIKVVKKKTKNKKKGGK